MKFFFKRIVNYLKNLSKSKKVALCMSMVFLLLLSSVGAYYLHVRSRIFVSANSGSFNSDIDYSDVEMEAPLYEEQKGITNILLIGTDAREIDEPSRSDSIIIATIDDNNRNIKFTSIMRDSYVEIPKHKTQKINAAYQMGGPELLMKTIEMNFRIKLDKYIIVNFWGFEDIIDSVGGVEVDVKEHEIKEINKYIGETREIKSPPLLFTGYQKLDGQQALAYARIRKTDSEYNRTERQREVLGLLAQKLKTTSIVNYPKVMESMLGCVRTNIEPASLLNYAYTVSKFEPLQVEQLQVPMNDLSWGGMYNGAWVLLMDRNQNAKVMNDFIFTNKNTTKEELDLKAFKSVLNEYFAKAVKVEHVNEEPSLDSPTEKDIDKEDNKDKTEANVGNDTKDPSVEDGKNGTGTSESGTEGSTNPPVGSNGVNNPTAGVDGSNNTNAGTGGGNTGAGNGGNTSGSTGTVGGANGSSGTGASGSGTTNGGTNTGSTGANQGGTAAGSTTNGGSSTQTGTTNTEANKTTN